MTLIPSKFSYKVPRMDSRHQLIAWGIVFLLLALTSRTLYMHKVAAERALKKEQQLYEWIQTQPAPKKEANQDAPPLISSAIEAANRHNLLIGRLQPKGENVLICSFSGVNLGVLLLWIDELKSGSTPLSFPKIIINTAPSDNTGSVNATVYVSG